MLTALGRAVGRGRSAQIASRPGLRFMGLGFRVEGSGFRGMGGSIKGYGFRVYGFRVEG